MFSYIGSLTGVKPGIFSVSINERNALRGGYIGLIEWLTNTNRNQSFITFAIRDMLTKAQNYDEVVKYLAEVHLVAPCYYIIAGPKPGQVSESLILTFETYVLKGCDHYSRTQRFGGYQTIG